ncbi:hypothetical protein B296_00052030 [Ensete ventricosum]|uniref:Cytosolic Fe-S cluster assembly factor NBP35 n=1 Tax=Ensete ventricosum TaxID=4639 RepID=A0A426YDX1_ENSVE|nr:hypothetical protein B296_00052030 [Ensete ventricosum]
MGRIYLMRFFIVILMGAPERCMSHILGSHRCRVCLSFGHVNGAYQQPSKNITQAYRPRQELQHGVAITIPSIDTKVKSPPVPTATVVEKMSEHFDSLEQRHGQEIEKSRLSSLPIMSEPSTTGVSHGLLDLRTSTRATLAGPRSNLGVMSISFMLPNPDDAVIWRGTRKNGLIKQFLKDVDWGELDYLVVVAPPGTSDEHISVVLFLQATGIDGAIIVTTPQQVSLIDVRKEISFCKKVGIQFLGVVENMSELRLSISDFRFLKPTETGDWNDVTEWALSYIRSNALELLSVISCSEVFDSIRGGAAKMCAEMGVPFLGKVPLQNRRGSALMFHGSEMHCERSGTKKNH